MSKETLIQNIEKVINASTFESNIKISADLGETEEWLAKNAFENGLNIQKFHHIIDNYFVKHVFKAHGNIKQESKRGQIAITKKDIIMIPCVLSEADFIIYGAKNKIQNSVIIFVKNQNNESIFFIEEVRKGKKELAGDTIYKLAGTSDAYTLSRHPTLYVRNDTSTIKIIDIKTCKVK